MKLFGASSAIIATFCQIPLLSEWLILFSEIIVWNDVRIVVFLFAGWWIETFVGVPHDLALCFLALWNRIDVGSWVLRHLNRFQRLILLLWIDQRRYRGSWRVLDVGFISKIRNSVVFISYLNSLRWPVSLIIVLILLISIGSVGLLKLIEHTVIFNKCQRIDLNSLLIVWGVQSDVRPQFWLMGRRFDHTGRSIENLNWFLCYWFLCMRSGLNIGLLASSQDCIDINSHFSPTSLRSNAFVDLLQSLTDLLILLIYFWKISVAFHFGLVTVPVTLKLRQTFDLAHLILWSILNRQTKSGFRHGVYYLCANVIPTVRRVDHMKEIGRAAVGQVALLVLKNVLLKIHLRVLKSKVRMRLRRRKVDLSRRPRLTRHLLHKRILIALLKTPFVKLIFGGMICVSMRIFGAELFATCPAHWFLSDSQHDVLIGHFLSQLTARDGASEIVIRALLFVTHVVVIATVCVRKQFFTATNICTFYCRWHLIHVLLSLSRSHPLIAGRCI